MQLKNLLLLGPLLFATPAVAGDLITELIPADARWLAHVDVEAFLGSTLWQAIRAEPELARELESGLEEARAEFGFDPLQLVKAVTAYGTSENPEEAVAVLVVSDAADGLLAKLREQPIYSAQQIGGHAVDVWSQGDDESVFCHVREFEGISNRLVFLSDSSERLMHGIGVLEGRVKDITQATDVHVAAKPLKNTFVYFETSEDIPGMGQVEQISAVAALAQGLRFELGEAAGQLFIDLSVTTLNAKDAQNVHSVLQGATALLNLVMPQEIPAEVRDLVRNLHFGINGNQVGIEFRHDSRELLRIVKRLQELDTEAR